MTTRLPPCLPNSLNGFLGVSFIHHPDPKFSTRVCRKWRVGPVHCHGERIKDWDGNSEPIRLRRFFPDPSKNGNGGEGPEKGRRTDVSIDSFLTRPRSTENRALNKGHRPGIVEQ